MLQGLENKTVDEKLNSLRVGEVLLRKIEEVMPSRGKVRKVTQAMLKNQDLIAPVEKIVQKETRKAVDARSEKKY